MLRADSDNGFGMTTDGHRQLTSKVTLRRPGTMISEPARSAARVDRFDTHHGLVEWRRLSDKFERYPKARRLVCVGPARFAGSTASSSGRPMMRFYQQQHGFYCGVDLHARTMHVCVVDDEGQTRDHVNLPCDGGRFLKLIEPYREQLVVSCECMFS
jgi:hypothetical protein